jgi:DNA-3-methyladenine glycosylase
VPSGLRGRRLPRRFYAADSPDLAPRLLNKVLAVRGPDGIRAARIIEVEAYAGETDPASHAYRGPTRRNGAMFGPPGHLYVYFTYGMHWCANVVCGQAGVARAVLLRAGAPVRGLSDMRAARGAGVADRDLCRGPARLAQALGLSRPDDGADLVGGARAMVLDDGTPPPDAPGVGCRVGLAVGGERPWRWWVPGDPLVSAYRSGTKRMNATVAPRAPEPGLTGAAP